MNIYRSVEKVLLMCVTSLILLMGCGKGENMKDAEEQLDFKQISMKEGLELMEADSDYILLDVRRIDEFEAGHIPGAVNIPNELIGAEEIAELPDKNQTIYVYCRSGNRSKQAAQKLAGLGYTNIVEFGGIIDYSGELEKGRE